MKRKIQLFVIIFILLFSLVGLAETEPPGTFPEKGSCHLFIADEEDFELIMAYRTDQGHGIEKDAIMGVKSPNGKYYAYTKTGPYLQVESNMDWYYLNDQELKKIQNIMDNFPEEKMYDHNGFYSEDFNKVLIDQQKRYEYLDENYKGKIVNIPWGVWPVWSPDNKYIYYMKIKENFPEDVWLNWFRYSEGMYRVEVQTGEIEQITDQNDVPGSFGYEHRSHILFFSRWEDGGTWIHTYNTNTGEIKKTVAYGRIPITSPDGNIAYSGYPHTAIYVNTTSPWKLTEDCTIRYFFKGEPFPLITGINKTGSFTMLQRPSTYAQVDPREDPKHYWNLYFYDANSNEPESLFESFFDYQYPRFRRGTNEMLYSLGVDI